MNATVLAVWLLTGTNSVNLLYAVDYPTPDKCQQQATKLEDQRTGLKQYPVKHAECVMKVKAEGDKNV